MKYEFTSGGEDYQPLSGDEIDGLWDLSSKLK